MQNPDESNYKWANYVFVRIYHTPEFDLIQETRNAIQQGPGRWFYDSDGEPNKNIFGTREVDSPKIKNATWYEWDAFPSLTIVQFIDREGSVTMQNEPTGTLCFVTADEPIGSDKTTGDYAGFFVGRVLYHFAKHIARIEILPQQLEPDWEKYVFRKSGT